MDRDSDLGLPCRDSRFARAHDMIEQGHKAELTSFGGFILSMSEERLNKIARLWVRFTRWAIAPFCLGLLAALLIILVQFSENWRT